jgi:hypothetical protein
VDAEGAKRDVRRLGHLPETATSASGIASRLTTGASTPAVDSSRRTRYSLLQMNLCLSGMAECFEDTRYPKVVEEAIEVIVARKPSAVSFNEACSGDISRIAAKTRYHVRFAPVLVRGQRLPCVTPAGRGVFGNAVITRESIRSSTDRAFAAQVGGQERRRWICVKTVAQVSVCTAHLSTRGPRAGRAAHQNQCAQFAGVLASRDRHGAVIAAGDINHHEGCAPAGVRARTDARGSQLPGRQHSYVSAEEFRPPRVQIVPAAYSDHDFMLTSTSLLAPPHTRVDPVG